mmetsp:Transcript_6954/g.19526  ORF Transcript_6954/g.19526 Transcript_6954/m.19526 type:complete len:222 (+) Transcript_6954:520-1185(+)
MKPFLCLMYMAWRPGRAKRLSRAPPGNTARHFPSRRQLLMKGLVHSMAPRERKAARKTGTRKTPEAMPQRNCIPGKNRWWSPSPGQSGPGTSLAPEAVTTSRPPALQVRPLSMEPMGRRPCGWIGIRKGWSRCHWRTSSPRSLRHSSDSTIFDLVKSHEVNTRHTRHRCAAAEKPSSLRVLARSGPDTTHSASGNQRSAKRKIMPAKAARGRPRQGRMHRL